MAYTPNPANANGVNEAAYLADFTRNQAAIEAHKRSRGGSYEDAYRAVTGRPWPDGRSVKVTGGRAEMSKDRTVKSVLGKYVLPAAAAAVTGGGALGVGPMAGVFGAGAGASGGAAASGAAGGFGGPVAATAVPTGLGFGGLTAAQAAGYGAGSSDFLGALPTQASRSARGVASALGGGGESGWMDTVFRLLSGIPAIVASRQNQPSAQEQATQQQLTEMLKSQQRRTTSQDPLFDAVTQLAMQRLPTNVQR